MKITALIAKITDMLRSLLFPPKCIGCARMLTDGDTDICQDCSRAFARAKLVPCEHCGEAIIACRCRYLGTERLPLYSMLGYTPLGGSAVTDPVSHILLSRKTRLDEGTEEFLSRHMSALVECICKEHPDVMWGDWCLTYPPRSRKKRIAVGHDQSEELAGRLSLMTGIALTACLERRAHEDTAQKTLDAQQRAQNAENSYQLADGAVASIREKHVILIDDIATTGSTLCACAALLRKAGCADVVALTVARTVHAKHENM